MTDIEYKEKKYDFSWWSIAFFAIFCPLITIVFYELFNYFWVYTHLPFIMPIINILNLITSSEIKISSTTNFYLISIPDKAGISFVSACTGVYAYAIYLGICLATPFNKYKNENRNSWFRRLFTFIIPSILVYLINILRMVLVISVYYSGVPFNPFHEYLGYFTTFFAVFVFYIISYFWFPEFSLFVIWIKEQIKNSIDKIKMKKAPSEEILDAFEDKKAKKSLIFTTWFIICTIIIMIVSIFLI